MGSKEPTYTSFPGVAGSGLTFHGNSTLSTLTARILARQPSGVSYVFENNKIRFTPQIVLDIIDGQRSELAQFIYIANVSVDGLKIFRLCDWLDNRPAIFENDKAVEWMLEISGKFDSGLKFLNLNYPFFRKDYMDGELMVNGMRMVIASFMALKESAA